MASSNGQTGAIFPTSLLMDPKAMKKQMANASQSNKALGTRDTLQASTSILDPRRLLDPKGFDKGQHKADDLKDNHSRSTPLSRPHTYGNGTTGASECSLKLDLNGDNNIGQGSLIEKAYNVSHREERPIKKQKVEKSEDFEGEEKSRMAFSGASSGDLGEYVKQKKKEGLKESRPVTTAVVDLTTADDDDDDVRVVSDTQDKEVCYGRIDNAKVQAHAVPSPSPKAFYLSKDMWPAMKLSLARHPGKDNIIRVIDPTGFDFGNCDIKTSLALARIMDSKRPKFRTQAKLAMRRRNPTDFPRKEVSEYYDLIINLYGPRRVAENIGRFLSQRQVYLRTPISSDNGIEIYNPQQPTNTALKVTPNGHGSSSNGTGIGYVSRTTEEIRNDVVGMFDSLERSENMPEMEPDPRVKTPLLSHQKQALHFLTSKEQPRAFGDKEEDNNSLWRVHYRQNGAKSYYNVITGNEEMEKPREMLGGILADMMGLGKTLNMLALIVGSLGDANEFGEQPCLEDDNELILERNAKSTLLVAPLSTLANWEQQIATHIEPNTLKYYLYHGSNRTTDVNELAKYDVIITTYSTISSEYSRRNLPTKRGKSPLLTTNFFRVILDEAHSIREQSTQQAQAICALAAQRRWAVTGTPVQNRLDDLGGIIKFLRLRPFSDKGGFAQYVLAPFKSADPEIIPKLRLLVDSITLRRLKDRIDLPARHDKLVKLEFSEDERALYEWFAKDSQNRLRIIAGEQRKSLGGRTYAHILRAILRLRLLCAHGRELLSQDDLKIAEGFSAENAIDLEAEDDELTSALNPKQAYEMLMLLQESASNKCIVCDRALEIKDQDNENDEIIGCMLPCYHVVCADCMDGHIASIEQSFQDSKFKCRSCGQLLPKSFFHLTKYGIEEAEEARAIARENPRQAKIMGRYGGPHTKVKVLLESLKKAEEASKSLPDGEPPIKSVVFSGWTANLDLIQIALEDNKIPFARLDGKMARKHRNAALDAFRDNPAVCVILVSIGAGGLGLNLTTGSQVFMMEPQFNPASEAQAVDRVHRLGQTRDVHIHRFIMNDSFEEKMLELQRKKQNLADLSMNRGKLDRAEAAKKKLDELRSLFK